MIIVTKEKMLMKNIKVKFKDWLCRVEFNTYSNNRLAILLIDADNGEDIATATVNMPEHDLSPNEVIIKDYSENDGMLTALVEIGLVKPTGMQIQTGFVYCPICKINLDMLPKEIAKQIKENYEAWNEMNVGSKNEAGD